MEIFPYDRYKEKKELLTEHFLNIVKEIGLLPFEAHSGSNVQEYLRELAKINKFQESFGWTLEEYNSFEALLHGSNFDPETISFRKEKDFEKIYYYLSKINETFNRWYSSGEKNDEGRDFEHKISKLMETLKIYSHNSLSTSEKYKYIRKFKAMKLEDLRQTTIDEDLFTALYEYHSTSPKRPKVKEFLLNRITLEIGNNLNSDKLISKRIKDHGNIFWGLSTILTANRLNINKTINNIEDFKKVIVENMEEGQSYPKRTDLRHECTREVMGEYRTQLYVLQNLVDVYSHFQKKQDNGKHEQFLNDVGEFIISISNETILNGASEERSSNVYFLCMQIEVIFKLLNLEEIGFSKKKEPKKGEEKIKQFPAIEYQNQEDTILEFIAKDGNHYIKIKDKQEHQLNLNPQQLNLLKEIIKKKKIHWIEGIHIFPEWIKQNKTPPNRKFATEINRLNSEFMKKVNVKIAESVSIGRGGDGFYRLRENIKIIAKDREKVEKLYKEAEKNKEKKEFSLALEKIKEAIFINSTVEAYVLLITLYCLSDEKPSKELLGKSETAFIGRIEILKDACTYMYENFKEKTSTWTSKEVSNSYYEIGTERERLEKQNERATKLSENIKPDLNEEEKFWLQIAEKIDEFRKNEFASEQNKDKAFESLISDLENKNIFTKVARRILEAPWARVNMETHAREAKTCFWQFMISEEPYPSSPARISQLEVFLINSLKERILEVHGRDEMSKRISPDIDLETAERLNAKKL